MKIQVLKKGSRKVDAYDPCPWLVEYPPSPVKK